jgi:hypothetical protein
MPEIRSIRIQNVTTSEAVGGKVINFEIFGLINSMFARATDTFGVYTMDSTGNYIDAKL